MIMCVLLCYPVSIHMSQLQATGRPISSFQKQLNQILFKFVWDGKPDKIKRTTICHDYLKGSLKMINIKNPALKLSWVRQFLSS